MKYEKVVSSPVVTLDDMKTISLKIDTDIVVRLGTCILCIPSKDAVVFLRL